MSPMTARFADRSPIRFAIFVILLAGNVLATGSLSCGQGDGDGDGDVDSDSDGDGDGDGDTDGDTDGDADADGDGDANGDGDADIDSDADSDGDGDADADVDGDADADGEVDWVVTCADSPPPGAELPDPPPPYSGGVCPTLVEGRNTLPSGGHDRELILVLPAGLDPSEQLPVIFMWHWLGGDAEGFLEEGEVQAAADELRFIAAIPEARDDLLLRWPFLAPPLNSDARRDEELSFFDDMLSCIVEQYNINVSCVSSAGVSAGGLWTSHLAQMRSQYLASFLSLSGGVGPALFGLVSVREWTGAEHNLPAMVLWGGPTDFCGVDFATTSHNLETGLTDDGHYLVECIHNCSHAQPPFEPPPGSSAFSGMWGFVLRHPFWLPDGVSPYQETGLPDTLPEWCGQGPGSATIRSGECEGGILGSCI